LAPLLHDKSGIANPAPLTRHFESVTPIMGFEAWLAAFLLQRIIGAKLGVSCNANRPGDSRIALQALACMALFSALSCAADCVRQFKNDLHRENDNKKNIAVRQNRAQALTRFTVGSKNVPHLRDRTRQGSR
jgi:hypothetical protein